MSSLQSVRAALCRAKIGHIVKGTTRNVQAAATGMFSTRTDYPFQSLTSVFVGERRSFSKCTSLHVPRGRPRGSLSGNVSPASFGKSENNPPVFQDYTKSEDIREELKSSNLTSQSEFPPEFPSDYQKIMKARRRDQARGSFRPKIDPQETSILLFPGQGSQFVGMGKKVINIPKAQEIYEVASDILGYDLLDLCLNGPREKLDKTVHCQPAVFVTSLAAVEKLKEENEMAIEHCIATAGFSVGEFAALVFAGSLSFEEGLEIVQQRAEAMQAASEEIPSGMMTAFLGPNNKTKLACHTAKLYCIKELGMNQDDVDCVVANFLYPECKVIAGNVEALDFIKKNSQEFGIRRTKHIPVSGAFHSKLMYPARAAVSKALSKVNLKRPLVNVHSNVDVNRYRDVNTMRKLLSRQVCEPVKWEQILHKLYERKKDSSFPNSYEVGPGKQLGAILKMTNGKAYGNYRPVDV